MKVAASLPGGSAAVDDTAVTAAFLRAATHPAIVKAPHLNSSPTTIAAKIITKKLFTKIIFVIITKTLFIRLENARKRPQKYYKN